MGHPLLRDQYFDENPADPIFWSKWGTKGPWCATLLPLYEWEGILFVGYSCLKNVTVDGAWCLVQAQRDPLNTRWNQLRSLSFPKSTETVPPGPILEKPNLEPVTQSETSAPVQVQVQVLLQAQPTTQGQLSDTAQVDALAKAPPNDWEKLWSLLDSKFDQSMVLLFRNNKATPWRVNPRLQGRLDTSGFSIESASAFRIAYRTHKPFHGPPQKSETLDLFFSLWNNGHYPESLTIIPLISGEILIGFLIGWGPDKLNYDSATMSLAEEGTQALIRMIAKRPDLIKAA